MTLLALAVFAANYYHEAEQSTYRAFFVPLAERLLAWEGYSLPGPDSEPAFYPLWGYASLLVPGVALAIPGWWVLLVQVTLAIASILLFSRQLGPPSWWHAIAWVPFLALLSVKWPDAIAGVCLWFWTCASSRYLSHRSVGALATAAASLVALAQFRPEYTWLPALLAALLLVPVRPTDTRRLGRLVAVLALASIAAVTPWVLRSWAATGTPMIGSSNQGLVMFITLGQLQPNPWGIEHRDEYAAALVAAQGAGPPTSLRANRLLMAAWWTSVDQHPRWFLRKVVSNLGRVPRQGLYVGEYRDRAGTLAAWLAPVERVYAVLFGTALVALLGVPAAWRRLDSSERCFVWIALALLAYKIAIVGLIQYEPRHMNAVVLPVFGCLVLMARGLGRDARMI